MRVLIRRLAGALGVLLCTTLACSRFEGEPGAPAPGADAAVEAAPDAAPPDAGEPGAVDVPAPTELALNGKTLYIATGGASIFRWAPGQAAATVFTPESTDAHDLQVGFGSLYFATGANVLFRAPLAGANDDGGPPAAAVQCKGTARRVLVHRSFVIFTDSTGIRSTDETCATDASISTSNAALIANDGDMLLLYQPDLEGGRIVRCVAATTCVGNGVLVAKGLGTVVAMTTDTDRIYWATSGGVFSKLKAAGETVTLATGSGLPKTLAAAGGMLFWTDHDKNALMSAPAGGGAPAVTVASIDKPWGLVVTATELYVSAFGSNRVMRLDRP